MRLSTKRVVSAVLIGFLHTWSIGGCGYAEKNAFDAAKRANAVDAMEEFLKTWPAGRHSKEAVSLLQDLIYRDAKAKNTASAIRTYLAENLAGSHREEARLFLEDLT